VSDRGYVLVRAVGHHRAQQQGSYVPEHVLVAERALGRPLPAKHPVHHANEDTADNRNGNLVVCENAAYHHLLHQRMRALAACGDASALRCYFCHGYDKQDDIRLTSQGRPFHNNCQREYTADYRRNKRDGTPRIYPRKKS
jgi:hypothetical protein